MAQLYSNFLAGLVSDDPLSNVATTFNSDGLANLPTVAAPDFMYIVLDPDGVGGAPEIVRVTAHTGAATSATIVRGQQSTVARTHVENTTWVVSATKADYDELPFRIATAKGDLIVGLGTNDVARQPIGANNTLPVADSSQATGLRYDTIKTAMIADSQITTAKIADSQVTSAKIADSTIVLADLAAALIETIVPAGTIRSTIYTTADTGWLLFNQTVSGAESLYPTLWAKAPAAWKSGSDLVLPDLTGAVLRGQVTSIGALGGSNTQTLSIGNMPSHNHTINHDHPAGTTGFVSNDHTHTYSGTTSTGGNHQHASSIFPIYTGGFDGQLDLHDGGGSTGYALSGLSGDAAGNHNHTFSGATSGISTNHNHTFDVAAFSGSSGSAGSGTPFSIQENGMNVVWQIKAH